MTGGVIKIWHRYAINTVVESTGGVSLIAESTVGIIVYGQVYRCPILSCNNLRCACYDTCVVAMIGIVAAITFIALVTTITMIRTVASIATITMMVAFVGLIVNVDRTVPT